MASIDEHGDIVDAVRYVRENKLDELIRMQAEGFDPIPHYDYLLCWASEGCRSDVIRWLESIRYARR